MPAPLVVVPPSSRQPAVAVLVAMALVAIVAATGALAFRPGTRFPDRWDRRVATIARFVEIHRGHRFKHPVAVYFLSPEEYSRVTGDDHDGSSRPTRQERERSRADVAEYRALGLMEGDPDLLAANRTLHDSGTLAFYSPVDHVVNVRGRKLTVGVRVTLAHELTHALQDQYFDLSPIAAATTSDESAAARSVVEGDALSTEDAYVEQLPSDEEAAYRAESDASQDQATNDLADVPDVLQVLFGSYYTVGRAFVDLYQAVPRSEPDPKRIDQVLRRLPKRSADLYEPLRYVKSIPGKNVPAPEVTGERRRFEDSTLGADLLFVMLSERIDPVVALHATDGLLGDAYRASFMDNDRLCVTDVAVMATEQDAVELHDALSAWSRAMPAEADIVVEDATGVRTRFTTCDPGASAKLHLSNSSSDALAFPVTRLQAAAQYVTAGHPLEVAFCYGDRIVSAVKAADLLADKKTPALEAAILSAERDCG
jgi:hypothetical protein